MGNIALISCVSKKCLYKTEAKNMYTSSLFVKSLKYANDILKPNRIFILSAKYGLLNINEKIEPYNETLNDKNQKEKREWANNVINQLMKEGNINNDRFIFLAGKNYYENLILSLPNNEILMENLQIGKRLQWLKENLNEK
jgi:cytoplasmic iron level regulating protein YaaA (DUF328/UPF0246 family)